MGRLTRETMIKVVVCDVDGTLANNDHRRHWLLNKPKNWKAWYAGLEADTPYHDIVRLAQILGQTYPLIICTGREGSYREQTERWLQTQTPLGPLIRGVYTRGVKDYRGDDIVKL